MNRIATVFFLGVLLIGGVAGLFYFYVGQEHNFSPLGQDWEYFGSYFGGVAGALLSFISILLLVYTLHLQSEQIADAQRETLKRDVLAHVTKADDEITHWLQRKLAVQGGNVGHTVDFGDIVWGIAGANTAAPNEFTAAVVRLLQLTTLYCESLALYRDNINSHYIFKFHQQKAQAVVDFLSQHQARLGQMGGPNLAICRHNLRSIETALPR